MSATYSVSHYREIAKVDAQHFWFRARGAMLTALIKQLVPKDKRGSFLEVGCGTGIVLGQLQALGFSVTGLDVNQTALDWAKRKCPDAHLIRQSIYSFTSPHRFGAVGAFDVLEHQTQDVLFLKRCWALLEKEGTLFLTVPAGQWLWSRIDVISGHKRRYEVEDLRERLRIAGFHVQFMNYWNVFPLPWYMLFRIYATHQRFVPTVPMYLHVPNGFINTLLYYLLRVEQLLFFTLPFPRGATLVVCARKVTS
ncbi:MAG: class I SAM-dependent methyltransferase [Patescibacteria group bacterium]